MARAKKRQAQFCDLNTGQHEGLEQCLAALAFESCQAMLKSALGLLICTRCDCAQPVGAAKLREGLACYLYGALRFPSVVLVIDCQLLIRLEASYRTPQDFSPKLARESVISLALGQPCERCSRRTVSFCRQGGGNRALIEFTRTLQFTTPLVDARDSIQFQRVTAARLRVRKQREHPTRQRGQAAQVHLVVPEDRHERFGGPTAQEIEVNARNEF